jgi:hypothetical protein
MLKISFTETPAEEKWFWMAGLLLRGFSTNLRTGLTYPRAVSTFLSCQK